MDEVDVLVVDGGAAGLRGAVASPRARRVPGNVADLRAQVGASAARALLAGARSNADLVEREPAPAVQRRTGRRSV